jgi:hypothetical protein
VLTNLFVSLLQKSNEGLHQGHYRWKRCVVRRFLTQMLTPWPVFQYVNKESSRLVNCLICPKTQGHYHEFNLKHIRSHQSFHVHQRHLKFYASGRTTLSGYDSSSQRSVEQRAPEPPPDIAGPSNNVDETEPMIVDDHEWIGGIPDESEPMLVMPEVPSTSTTLPQAPELEDDQQFSLRELWEAISTSRYQKIDGTRDLFDELQEVFASGEALFSTPMSPLNATSTEDIECDVESNFGIELIGEYL